MRSWARLDWRTNCSTVPPYWTGTCNKVWATAVGGPFQRAIVKVGGTVVRDIEFEGGLQQHFTLTPIIDSTHFPHGTYATIDLEVQKTNGTWLYESDSVVIKNRGMAWEHPDFAESLGSHTSEIVQSALNGMNWTCYEDSTYGWDHESVENMLDGSGVHYVNSHGSPARHITSVWISGEPDAVFWDGGSGNAHRSYLYFRINQMGDYSAVPPPDAPPYNPTGTPQVSFAFFDSCNSGASAHFSKILYPYRIYDYMPPDPDPLNTPYAFNQAVMGWNGLASSVNGARMNEEWWSRLAAGMTVREAREDMMTEAQNDVENGEAAWLVIMPNGASGYEPVDSIRDIPILGDLFTRIKGVYTGSDDLAPNGWYL